MNPSNSPSSSKHPISDPKDEWWAGSDEKYFGMENVCIQISVYIFNWLGIGSSTFSFDNSLETPGQPGIPYL